MGGLGASKATTQGSFGGFHLLTWAFLPACLAACLCLHAASERLDPARHGEVELLLENYHRTLLLTSQQIGMLRQRVSLTWALCPTDQESAGHPMHSPFLSHRPPRGS